MTENNTLQPTNNTDLPEDPPLGNNSPLLVPVSLGQSFLQPKFIYPLGAISLINPNYLQLTSDFESFGEAFRDSPFFDHPLQSATVENISQSNQTNVQAKLISQKINPQSRRSLQPKSQNNSIQRRSSDLSQANILDNSSKLILETEAIPEMDSNPLSSQTATSVDSPNDLLNQSEILDNISIVNLAKNPTNFSSDISQEVQREIERNIGNDDTQILDVNQTFNVKTDRESLSSQSIQDLEDVQNTNYKTSDNQISQSQNIQREPDISIINNRPDRITSQNNQDQVSIVENTEVITFDQQIQQKSDQEVSNINEINDISSSHSFVDIQTKSDMGFTNQDKVSVNDLSSDRRISEKIPEISLRTENNNINSKNIVQNIVQRGNERDKILDVDNLDNYTDLELVNSSIDNSYQEIQKKIDLFTIDQINDDFNQTSILEEEIVDDNINQNISNSLLNDEVLKGVDQQTSDYLSHTSRNFTQNRQSQTIQKQTDVSDLKILSNNDLINNSDNSLELETLTDNSSEIQNLEIQRSNYLDAKPFQDDLDISDQDPNNVVKNISSVQEQKILPQSNADQKIDALTDSQDSLVQRNLELSNDRSLDDSIDSVIPNDDKINNQLITQSVSDNFDDSFINIQDQKLKIDSNLANSSKLIQDNITVLDNRPLPSDRHSNQVQKQTQESFKVADINHTENDFYESKTSISNLASLNLEQEQLLSSPLLQINDFNLDRSLSKDITTNVDATVSLSDEPEKLIQISLDSSIENDSENYLDTQIKTDSGEDKFISSTSDSILSDRSQDIQRESFSPDIATEEIQAEIQRELDIRDVSNHNELSSSTERNNIDINNTEEVDLNQSTKIENNFFINEPIQRSLDESISFTNLNQESNLLISNQNLNSIIYPSLDIQDIQRSLNLGDENIELSQNNLYEDDNHYGQEHLSQSINSLNIEAPLPTQDINISRSINESLQTIDFFDDNSFVESKPIQESNPSTTIDTNNTTDQVIQMTTDIDIDQPKNLIKNEEIKTSAINPIEVKSTNNLNTQKHTDEISTLEDYSLRNIISSKGELQNSNFDETSNIKDQFIETNKELIETSIDKSNNSLNTTSLAELDTPQQSTGVDSDRQNSNQIQRHPNLSIIEFDNIDNAIVDISDQNIQRISSNSLLSDRPQDIQREDLRSDIATAEIQTEIQRALDISDVSNHNELSSITARNNIDINNTKKFDLNQSPKIEKDLFINEPIQRSPDESISFTNLNQESNLSISDHNLNSIISPSPNIQDIQRFSNLADENILQTIGFSNDNSFVEAKPIQESNPSTTIDTNNTIDQVIQMTTDNINIDQVIQMTTDNIDIDQPKTFVKDEQIKTSAINSLEVQSVNNLNTQKDIDESDNSLDTTSWVELDTLQQSTEMDSDRQSTIQPKLSIQQPESTTQQETVKNELVNPSDRIAQNIPKTVIQMMVDSTDISDLTLPTVLQNLGQTEPLGNFSSISNNQLDKHSTDTLLPQSLQTETDSTNLANSINNLSATSSTIQPKFEQGSQTNNRQEFDSLGWSNISELLANLPPAKPSHNSSANSLNKKVVNSNDRSPLVASSSNNQNSQNNQTTIQRSLDDRSRNSGTNKDDLDLYITPTGLQTVNPNQSSTNSQTNILQRTIESQQDSENLPEAKVSVNTSNASNEDNQDYVNFEDNIKALAQEIYILLRQRLAIEKERQGSGYQGRLPW